MNKSNKKAVKSASKSPAKKKAKSAKEPKKLQTVSLESKIHAPLLEAPKVDMVTELKKEVELNVLKNVDGQTPKTLQSVPHDYAFWVCDGTYVYNIHQLAEVIEKMGESTFKQHVNEQKNDFSNWIKDVMGEIELSENLRSTLEQKDHHVHILKHLVKDLSKN